MGRISTGGRRGTKPISVGRERLVIESNDPSVVQRFDDLFSGLPGDPVAPLISVTVDAVRDDQLGGRVHDWVYQTSVGDAVEVIDPDLRVHELWMTRFVNRRKLETEPDLLHLHSAAVARGNRAVLLVGRSGGGKSTLAAGLVRNGWDYVTDEQVTIVPRDLILRSYARPLTLRSEVWPQFRELPSVASVLRMNEAPERHLRVEVPPSEIGAVSAIAGLRSVVVFEPRRASGSPARSSAVADVAEALQMLAGTCYDSDRLGRSGIAALVEIACECPAWRLEYDGLDDASAEVERLIDESPTNLGPTRRPGARHSTAPKGLCCPGTGRLCLGVWGRICGRRRPVGPSSRSTRRCRTGSLGAAWRTGEPERAHVVCQRRGGRGRCRCLGPVTRGIRLPENRRLTMPAMRLGRRPQVPPTRAEMPRRLLGLRWDRRHSA